MRVMIFEPDHGGHRYTYVRHLIQGLKALEGLEIKLIISKEGAESEEFTQQIAPVAVGVEVLPELEVESSTPLDNARHLIRDLAGALERHPADHLYVPSSDGITQVLGARALIPGGRVIPKDTYSEAVMHRGSFAYPARDLQQRVKFALSQKTIEKSPWDTIHFVDPLAYEASQKLGGSIARRAEMLADPVDDVREIQKSEARKNLNIPKGGRYIGLSGAISERKGCRELLAAFDMATLKDDDRLLLAGRATDVIRDQIKAKYQHHVDAGRLILFDRYLTDDELAWSLAALDVVCPTGPEHIGLSNIALRAIAANRLILGPHTGWTGRIIPAFKVGAVCDMTSPSVLAEAMAQALEAGAWYKRGPAGDRLLQFHSKSNHIAGWTKAIRRRLGLPEPDIKSWEWALEGAQ